LLLEPDDPELHLRRGWTAYDKADFKTVFEQAREAIKLKPDYADVYDLMGATLARPDVGRQHEAITLYQKAVQLKPGNPLFHIHLMEVYECCGQPENALHEAEAVLRSPVALITNPNAVERYQVKTSFRVLASLERARNLAILGRLDEAKRAYDLAVHDDPGTLTYAGRAAFLLEMAQAPRDAVQADLDRSLAADPDNWFAHGLQARVYFYSKDYAAAAREFARALAIYPMSGEMHWQHAMTLRLLGRADEAASEAAIAFKVDPDFMLTKIPALQKFGFASAVSQAIDPRPALYDAARACMLDERCW
jgi:tetratricopeptide (TPR) repeat protein